MNASRLIAPLLLALLALPCQARKPADERPELYRSMINKVGVGLEVYLVDGAKFPFLKSKFRLESGRHRIEGGSPLFYRRGGEEFQASFAFEFEARAGQTYMLTVVPEALIGDDTQVCLMEEPRDMPKADIGQFGGLRHPGSDAVQVSCAPVVMRPV